MVEAYLPKGVSICVCVMSEYGSHHASETPDKLDSLSWPLPGRKLNV